MKQAMAFLMGFLTLFLGLLTGANAAIDASVGTALTAIQTDATSLSALVIPIVVAVMGLMITIKLIKKFGNKI